MAADNPTAADKKPDAEAAGSAPPAATDVTPAVTHSAPEGDASPTESSVPDGGEGLLSPEEEKLLMKEFYMEMNDVDRENEIMRILGAFKLNPFEQLGLRFDATVDDVKRSYRKSSLMVHPDKSQHPQAREAFEVLGQAYQALNNEQKLKELKYVLTLAQDDVVKEWKKKTKNDAATRLASVLHQEGQKGIEQQYRQSEEFHSAWKDKARDLLAKAEFRKRKITARLKAEEERHEEETVEYRKKMKATKEHHQKWESTRDTRVGTWRDFVTKKKANKGQKELHLGGIKPPKAKNWDDEKTYVQRPVGEQFAPPPPKGPQTKKGAAAGDA